MRFGHLFIIWIDLTAHRPHHTEEINMTTANQCAASLPLLCNDSYTQTVDSSLEQSAQQ